VFELVHCEQVGKFARPTAHSSQQAPAYFEGQVSQRGPSHLLFAFTLPSAFLHPHVQTHAVCSAFGVTEMA
jgi:hypothetical protein